MKILFERVRAILHAEAPQSWYRLGAAYANKQRWRASPPALEHALTLEARHAEPLEAIEGILYKLSRIAPKEVERLRTPVEASKINKDLNGSFASLCV